MLARALNVVEMSPIEYLLDSYASKFDPNQGTNPNIKEIMGLIGANIFILSAKDEKRKWTKLGPMKSIIKQDNEGEEERYFESEYDFSYSSDDDFDSASYRPIQIKSGNDSFNVSSQLLRRRIWHKDQLSLLIIGNIQQELNIGRLDWTYEAWIAFVYCFNERMKDIELKFNPDDEYKDETYYCNINEAKSIIDSFYPLYRIYEFGKNEHKIQLFVGKNVIYAKEIFRAMIRGFDDADRVVTPIHMFRETYEKRTPEILNNIFNY